MNFEKIGPWITLKLDDFCGPKMVFDYTRAFRTPFFSSVFCHVSFACWGLFTPRIWTGMQLVTILRVACGVIPSPRCALGVVNEIAHLGCKIINSTTIYNLGCNPELPLVIRTIYYWEGLVASGGNWTFLMFLYPL